MFTHGVKAWSTPVLRHAWCRVARLWADTRRWRERRDLWILLGIIVLALLVRYSVLLYNLSLDLPDAWHSGNKASLVQALHVAGLDTSALEAGSMGGIGSVTLEQGREWHMYGDSGLEYVHLFLIQLFGNTSYVHLQVLQLLLDAMLIIPVYRIAYVLGGKRIGLVATLAYALFVPQIWLATVPGYDFWASAGLLTSTWLIVEGIRNMGSPMRFFTFIIVGSLVVTLSGYIRSTVFFYPVFCAVVLLLLLQSSWRIRSLLVLGLLGGWTIGLIPRLVESYDRFGEIRLARNTVGHSFWTGVGEYDNPLGLKGSGDAEVERFYREQTGIESNAFGVEYNRWLTAKAIWYVRTYPLVHAKATFSRAKRMVLANSIRKYIMYRPIADTWAIKIVGDPRANFEPELAELKSSRGKLAGTLTFALDHPIYYLLTRIELMARQLWILVPVGLVAALALQRRRLTWVAALPVLYTLVTMAPFHQVDRNLITMYAAGLPVVVFGLSAMLLQTRWAVRRVARYAFEGRS